jgi:hypothetical protein
MEEEKKSGEKILDLAGDMVENYRNLITIKVVEHSSLAGASSILGILLMVVAVFILLFAGIGCAWWVGEELGRYESRIFYRRRSVCTCLTHPYPDLEENAVAFAS